MKRRQFIGMTATAAASLVLPAAAGDSEPVLLEALATPQLLDILHDERIVRELGVRYRQIVPAEDDERVLTQAILPEPARADSASLRARVHHQVQDDFAGDRTVTLNGWILSVTEARQCALYSLLPT